METAYHPSFGQQVPFRFTQLSDSADGQVRETIGEMLNFIRRDAASDLVAEDCRRALAMGDGDPIAGAWKMIKRAMRFQKDEETAAQLDAHPEKTAETIEVLIRPIDQSLMIRLRGIGIEDCDGFEMYAACLLLRLGIPCALVTVAASGEDPSRFSHVYLAAYPQGFSGPRIPLDFSHGPYPGWECPNHGRIKEWPVQVSLTSRICEMGVVIALLGTAYFGLRHAERKLL